MQTGMNTFSSKLPCDAAMDTATSLPMTCTATIVKKSVTGDDGSTSESTVSIPLYKEESRDNQISYTTETAVYYATVPEDVGEIGYDILSDFANLSVWTANYEDPSIMSILSGTTHDAQTNTYSGLMALTGTVGANGTASGLEGVPSDSKYLDCMLIRLPKTGEEGAAAYDTYVTVHIRRANDEEDPGYENPLEILEIYYNELKENTETGTQEPVEIKAHLFDNEEVTGSAVRFDPAAKIYYVCVPEGTDEVKLVLKGAPAGTPTVMHSDYAADGSSGITISNTSGSAYAWDGLVPMNGTVSAKDTTIPDGAMDGIPTSAAVYESYKDVILITVSDADGTSSTYTVHIMKGEVPDVPDPPEPSGEAYIKLNYGNSPYGEIMKDDTVWRTLDQYKDDPDGRAKWQADAKAAFDERNRYVQNYIPVSVSNAGINYTYSTRAWTDIANPASLTDSEKAAIADSSINMDRNETAIFIYNQKTFVDPGFTAKDSLGNDVKNINREITVMRSGPGTGYTGLKNDVVTEDVITISDKDKDYAISEITPVYVAGGKRVVRPDKYEMKYWFNDPVTGEKVSTVRQVIILHELSDTDGSGGITINDGNTVLSYVAHGSTLPEFTKVVNGENITEYVKDSAYRIYIYKVFDSDTSNTGTLNDGNAIKGAVAGARKSLIQLYVALPSGADI